MAERVERGQVLIDRFRLNRPLASDPLLEVWLAKDLELHRDVVIKVLHPRWMDDERLVERFRFEALVAAALVHENVARTFDVEQADGMLFTVSEYVSGPTVAQLLSQHTLPAAAVAAIGRQAALGLASAHADGIVHRAISPENLVIAPDGRLCLIDFGSVRAAGDQHLPDPVFPEPGVTAYWPPERRAGVDAGATGDVYSLGLVMWEALTGEPQVGDGADQRPVRRLLAGLPGGDSETPWLREVLLRATAEDPAARPTAAELAQVLEELAGVRPEEQLTEVLVRYRDE